MTLVATVFALLIAAQGLAMVVAPHSVVAFVRARFQRLGPLLISVGVILRLGVGACFFFAGWVARWPDFVQWFGILVGLGALAAIFMGPKRLERIIQRVASFPAGFFRIAGLAVLALGVLLVIGVQP